MFVLNCKILIGKYEFHYVESLEIETSWKQLSTIAKIRMPGLRNLLYTDIKFGDQVEIWLSYTGYDMHCEFKGYVSSVAPKRNLEIECEDGMYLLKRRPVKKSWRSIMLLDLVKELCPEVEQINCPSIELKPFYINSSAAKALQDLKDDYGLVAYFRPNGSLYVGMPYMEPGLGKVKLHLQKNVCENDLTFKSKEDVRILIKAVSILPNNTSIAVNAGDDGGEEHTLHFYGITNKEELKNQANAKLDSMKFEGYRGQIKSFGIPYYEHSWTGSIIDDVYPERNGDFIIDSVKVEFGLNGFRRIAELGRKITIV